MEVDWDKVETVDDLVCLIRAVYPKMQFQDTHPRIETIKHLLKESEK